MTTVYSVLQFYDPKKEHGCFSNYYIHKKPLIIDGLTYDSVEHYYQANKFMYETGDSKIDEKLKEYTEMIRTAKTANISKCLANQKIRQNYEWAKKVRKTIEEFKDLKLREDWEIVKDSIMMRGLEHKFAQDKKCRDILLSTKDFEKIQEDAPNDYYWGIGKDGSGLSKLGDFLVIIRNKL